MARRILALMLLTSAGCGTFINVMGNPVTSIDPRAKEKPTPFGGVARDLNYVGGSFVEGSFIQGTFFLVDTPLSLVGDVVTLPKVYRDRANCKATQPPSVVVSAEQMEADYERSFNVRPSDADK